MAAIATNNAASRHSQILGHVVGEEEDVRFPVRAGVARAGVLLRAIYHRHMHAHETELDALRGNQAGDDDHEQHVLNCAVEIHQSYLLA
jgi:hypothetical protein